MTDTPERPHERPTFDPAPPTEVGTPPAPPTQMAPPGGAPGGPSGAGTPPPGDPGGFGGTPAGGSPYGQPQYPAPNQSPGQPMGAPFGAAPYGATASPYQQKSKGGKVALIVVLVVVFAVLLLCGGIVGAIFWAANQVESSIPDGDRAGGPSNPISLDEGEAFEIDDFTFSKDWTVVKDAEYEYSEFVTIEGLEAENAGDSADDMYLTFTFITGSEELGEIGCHTDGDVQPDRTEELDCSGSVEMSDIEGYEEIEVATSY